MFAPSNDLVDENAGQSVTITGNLGATSEFSLGAFSTTTGFPSAVVFFEQRLVFANTATQPQTIFFSVSGDFEDFNAGTLNSSALTYTIGSNQVNVIRYLTASRALLIGTSGGEFVVRASSDEPISPTNTQILRQASYGSANIQPVAVANVVLFVQRAKRKLRELVYSFGSDSYFAPDLTILSENITDGLIKEIALQQEPDNIVWCVLENGKFVGMTYRREEEVVAWHDHEIGGTYTAGGVTYNYGFVESVATIPSSTGTEDEVYIVVARTIGGATKRYIERLKPIDFGTNVEDAFFVDSGLTYSGSSATTISGLTHLEGQTVRIVANGATHADKVVSSGAVTLDRATTKAHIGLPYTSTLQTMRIDAGGMQGTSQAKIKRINDVTVRLHKSVGVKVGSSESVTDLIPFRSSANAMDNPIALFSGDKEVEFDGGYETDGHIVVIQDQALPLTVLSIYPRITTFDE